MFATLKVRILNSEHHYLRRLQSPPSNKVVSFMGTVHWRHMDCAIVKQNEVETADYTSGMGIILKEAGHFSFDPHSG